MPIILIKYLCAAKYLWLCKIKYDVKGIFRSSDLLIMYVWQSLDSLRMVLYESVQSEGWEFRGWDVMAGDKSPKPDPTCTAFRIPAETRELFFFYSTQKSSWSNGTSSPGSKAAGAWCRSQTSTQYFG